jgi:endogenous inhibitor of DNA gyrase (YacG/DUF329 family)
MEAIMKVKCQNCGEEFQLNRMWQKFCCKRCQQQWNHAQYRADRVAAELELKGNGHGHATLEKRQKASEVMTAIVKSLTQASGFRRRI